jgi:hypothetical protein
LVVRGNIATGERRLAVRHADIRENSFQRRAALAANRPQAGTTFRSTYHPLAETTTYDLLENGNALIAELPLPRL